MKGVTANGNDGDARVEPGTKRANDRTAANSNQSSDSRRSARGHCAFMLSINSVPICTAIAGVTWLRS